MSVLVTAKIPGDVDKFRATLQKGGEELIGVAERAKSQGALHHRFGIGDGFVLVVDEWQSFEQFQAFFSAPELQEFVASAGGTGTPEITVTEAISSPDEF